MEEKPYVPPYKYNYVSKSAYDKETLSEAEYIKLIDTFPCFARIMDDIDTENRMVTWRCDILYGPYDCKHCKFRKERRND